MFIGKRLTPNLAPINPLPQMGDSSLALPVARNGGTRIPSRLTSLSNQPSIAAHMLMRLATSPASIPSRA
jgi:hypothetical protein